MTDEELKERNAVADEVMADANKELYDYDDALPDTGDGQGQPLLPAGIYQFKVLKMLRSRMEKGKCAGAKSVELTIKIPGTDQAVLKETLILHRNTVFKVRQFFRAIGQQVEDGQPFRPDWSQVQGATGEVEVEVNEFTGNDGKLHQNNRVKRWLPPAEDFESF